MNDRNKTVFVEYIFNDLSLGEIAENKDITRQGVHDIIKRTSKKLREYEDSLHLVKKFKTIEKSVSSIKDLIEELEEKEQPSETDIYRKIHDLADGILESL